jgi:secreted trypsin-like serine protease
MRTLRLLSTFLPLLLTHCEFELCLDASALGVSTDVVGTSDDAIIGGAVDSANRATVVLLTTKPDESNALCSGTIIATDGDIGYVLTAAHCVTGTVDHVYQAADWYDCAGAGDPAGCEASYVPLTWEAHPEYLSSSVEYDFAIVTFSGATAATPLVSVVSAQDDLVVGQAIELSGYGRTYAGASQPNQFQSSRNHVSVSLAEAMDTTLWFDATTGKTACFGDSGGPAYAHVRGERVVVGVAAAADPLCEEVAIYGRVAAVYEEFIAPRLPISEPPATCTECLQTGMRTSAACQNELDACLSNAACSMLLMCVEACEEPDQACYVACATPHPGGTVPFNELANCAACDACDTVCSDAACGSGSATTGSSVTSATSATSSGAGGFGSGGAGSTVGVGGASAGGSGSAANSGGSGADSADDGSPGMGGSSKNCIPLNIGCGIPVHGQSNGIALCLIASLVMFARVRRISKAAK